MDIKLFQFKKYSFVVFLTAFLVVVSEIYSQTDERHNIAIVSFDARGVSPIEAEAVADRIRNELMKSEVYQVVERGLMEEIMREQAFQLTGACTESSCLVEVGRVLAVHFMVGGSVTKVGNLFTIEARIVNVESGKIVQNVIEDYLGPIENLMVHTTRIVASKLMGLEEELEAVTLGGTSDLLVKSTPPGATIYINDSPIGDVTPYTIQGLVEGEYRIKAKKENLVGEKLVTLKKDEIKEIVLSLELEKFLIRLYSTPPGVDAYINGVKIGQTPVDQTVTDTTLDYIVELKKDLFKTQVDTVHFRESNLLRLNYTMPVCGRIMIPVYADASILINGEPMESLPNVYVEEREVDRWEAWVIDQLNFGEYTIRFEKKYHHPFETRVSLTEASPVKTIHPRFEKLESVLNLLNGPGDVRGEIHGGEFSKSFQISPNDNSSITVPYGEYKIRAKARRFLPFKDNVSVFSSEPQTIHLDLKRPDHRRAIKHSLFFPGVGQVYSLQRVKGAVFSLSMVGSIYWVYHSLNNYYPELDRYDEYTMKYTNAINIDDMNRYRILLNDSRDKLNSYRIQFIASLGLSAVTYLANLIDITWFYPYSGEGSEMTLNTVKVGNDNVLFITYSRSF